MKKSILLFSLFVFVFYSCSPVFTGKITYNIDYDLPESMEPQRSMLPTEMTTMIGEQHSKIVQNTMMGEQVTIFNVKTKMTTMEDIFHLQEMYEIKKQETDIEKNLKKLGYIN